MSGCILMLLLLVYHVSEAWSFRSKWVFIVLAMIAAPTQQYLIMGLFDLQHEYPDTLSNAQAIGSEIDILPSVIEGYIRKATH
jgi:hypothetical protein